MKGNDDKNNGSKTSSKQDYLNTVMTFIVNSIINILAFIIRHYNMQSLNYCCWKSNAVDNTHTIDL